MLIAGGIYPVARAQKKPIYNDGPDFSHEDAVNGLVCGIDEAGRAPLAGPVTAACVYIPDDVRELDFWKDVKDSKKISLKKREILFEKIKATCCYGVATADQEEIDTLNIHYATFLAMRRAYKNMCDDFTLSPKKVLVDGKFVPELFCEREALVKGDNRSYSIAAASILAKVTRDRFMTELHAQFPFYGWDRNAGYPTKEHLTALKLHGITSYHRKSFEPVRQYSLPLM